MSLRFSEGGPAFPAELIDAFMAGEVVILCGTGVSAPQLPDFKTLVDNTYEQLGVEMDKSERRSYDGQRFEEVLGALGRRLADSNAMVRAVSELLTMPADPVLDQHETVLRLSHDLNNRTLVVTTNFDTLLEHALAQPAAEVRGQSFAGQALPAPGGADFEGIIHLHGRLDDPALDLAATPLVLTSADYGDAYMRAGWASRFLFDLARCKTIVLIGYSAGDAPVRYFLNVLEADRARFPDLRQVYAFDSYEDDPADAEAGWGTLAVKPLAYSKINPDTGAADHSPLWNDLRQLADIVERPKRSREDRARSILVGDRGDLTDQQLRELTWLFSERRDLWAIALDAISDPEWFHVFHDHKLWSDKDAILVISAWISLDFHDPDRFEAAVEWQEKLGQDFLVRLDQLLRQNAPETPFWLRAWRILASTRSTNRANAYGFSPSAFILKEKVSSGLLLDRELSDAVAVLAPVVIARRPFRLHAQEDRKETSEPRLNDLVWLELSVADEYWAEQILEDLNVLEEKAARIFELCIEILRKTLNQAVDIGIIVETYDAVAQSVPSIENHEQNKHRRGVNFLVRAIVDAFPKVLASDFDFARTSATQWMRWPGQLGTRMFLHALRNEEAFSAEEALKVLLELGESDFWMIRREIALLLRDRAGDTNPELRAEVEARVRSSGDAHYSLYPLEEGQVDWRVFARDAVVWLRLRMLDGTGALSNEGRKELDAIVARNPDLERDVEDRDFFGSYTSGVRSVVGDSTAIVEADPDDRLEAALGLRESPDIERQMGWSAFCGSDPRGALEALSGAELSSPNIGLWNDLLESLAFRNQDEDAALRNDLTKRAIAHLEALNPDDLRTVAGSVVNLLLFGPREEIDHLEDWCDRLWEALRTKEDEVDFDGDLYEVALNHPVGRFSRILLAEHSRERDAAGPEQDRQRERLAAMVADDGPAGIIIRALLIKEIAFVLLADAQLVKDGLLPRLATEDEQGRCLRAVLVSHASITPDVTMVAPDAILRGVTEARPDSSSARQIAAGILRPAIASVREKDPDRWGIGEVDVRRALRASVLEVRTGALGILAQWMKNDEAGGEVAWEKLAAPFFDRVWPPERRFVDEALNHELMSIAVSAGKRFPDALKKLRPFFHANARVRGNLYPCIAGAAPEEFPRQVLDLLWLVYGPKGETNYDMAEVLDRLVKADPDIEVDRRFQSLEQRTTRHR